MPVIRDRVYRAWVSMRQRCNDPNCRKYRFYGGRGITYCKRWDAVENFRADMPPHPGKGWSLDRIDNNGNYEPGNCRWATQNMQQRNRSITKLTVEQVKDIRRRAHEKATALALEFGVSWSHIYYIRRDARWA